MIRPLVTIFLPLAGLVLALRLRTPRMLELLMAVSIVLGTIVRMAAVSLHPQIADMGPAMMVGILFVIYLYLPVRLPTSVALAAAFSVVAPLWWAAAPGANVPADQLYRLWLLVANALGFTAANSLQRSLRMQFAQSLLLQQLLSTVC